VDAASLNNSEEKNSDLKKQSQFAPSMKGIKPFMTEDYGDVPAVGIGENKPNPPEISMPTRNRRTSQSQFDAPFQHKSIMKPGESPPVVGT
jgi:hypothetical protein